MNANQEKLLRAALQIIMVSDKADPTTIDPSIREQFMQHPGRLQGRAIDVIVEAIARRGQFQEADR